MIHTSKFCWWCCSLPESLHRGPLSVIQLYTNIVCSSLYGVAVCSDLLYCWPHQRGTNRWTGHWVRTWEARRRISTCSHVCQPPCLTMSGGRGPWSSLAPAPRSSYWEKTLRESPRQSLSLPFLYTHTHTRTISLGCKLTFSSIAICKFEVLLQKKIYMSMSWSTCSGFYMRYIILLRFAKLLQKYALIYKQYHEESNGICDY